MKGVTGQDGNRTSFCRLQKRGGGERGGLLTLQGYRGAPGIADMGKCVSAGVV
jgi:hypothetical protein